MEYVFTPLDLSHKNISVFTQNSNFLFFFLPQRNLIQFARERFTRLVNFVSLLPQQKYRFSILIDLCLPPQLQLRHLGTMTGTTETETQNQGNPGH